MFLPCALIFVVAAAPSSPDLQSARKHDALLGGPAQKAQEKVGCPGPWVASENQAPGAKTPHQTQRCLATEAQIYSRDGKVFAVGLRLGEKLTAAEAKKRYQAAKAALTAEGCKVEERGQATIGSCARERLVAILENWDSSSDSHTLSAVYGQASVLGPLFGLK